MYINYRYGFKGNIYVVIFLSLFFLGVGVANSGESFPVYDATLYNKKPDMKKFGIESATIIYSQSFWVRKIGMDSLPNQSIVRQVANKNKKITPIQILDVEHWKLEGSDFEVNSSLSKYIQLLKWYKLSANSNVVGYYGLPISRDYWRAINKKDSLFYKEWQKENERLIPLAKEVDISFPSLYTFYNDPEGWVKYAIENINESRRINPGKPVYPFLWPMFHDSSFLLKGKYIPADFWRLQLETVRKYADGVIIWGGWDTVKTNKPFNWDNNAEWWKVLTQFVAEQP